MVNRVMTFLRRATLTAAALTVGLSAAAAQARDPFEISHHKPCNLFRVEEPVRFDVKLPGKAPATQATATVTNYFGQVVWKTAEPVAVNADAPQFALDIGKLDPGYYDLAVAVSSKAADGKDVTKDMQVSFGVTPFVSRTAKESREGGYRFGMKIFQIGKPGVWWRRPQTWELAEAVDASAGMGLQWTRHIFSQKPSDEPGIISTLDLINKHPMNVVMKIEGFPVECFDTARYGTLEEWEKKNGKGQWTRKTVPAKELYQKWLRAELEPLPTEQNVYEIANEPWGKISPEDFAEYCRMIVEVVRQVHPNALIGPNTGMGPTAWEIAFINAGGMKEMDMVTVHPYSFTPPPEWRTRASLRNYRDYLQRRLGRDVPLYITEYGWSTAPNSRNVAVVSERAQAQRTVRQSLMLYAEDCKVLIPHWIADREQDPTEREHWFGFFRLVGQPKPAVMALGACARMIDGSRFVGDLWYGPGIGAMVFERGGQYTLGLWTLDEQLGEGRDVQIDTGAEKVTVVDIMGHETPMQTRNGKVDLKLSADMTYVVGLGASVAKQAAGPDQPLNPERWSTHEGSFDIHRAVKSLTIDAKLDDWAGVKPIAMTSPKDAAPAADAHQTFMCWDDGNLYVAVRSADKKLVTASADQMAQGDHFTLSLMVRPDRLLGISSWDIYDYVLQVSPAPSDMRPALRMTNPAWDQPLLNPPPDSPSGLRWATATTNDGWIVEVKIPLKLLVGLPTIQAGLKIFGYVEVQDIGDGAKSRFAITPADDRRQWPYMVFQRP